MSRPIRSRHTALVWSTVLPGDLAGFLAGEDEEERRVAQAKMPVAEQLLRLGDPLDDCLSLLPPKILADAIWRLPSWSRTSVLRDLRIPQARRPSQAAAQHALARLRRGDPAKRHGLSQVLAAPALNVLLPPSQNPIPDAELLDTLKATTVDRNLVRLAALACWGLGAAPAALLRIALTETDLAPRSWPEGVVSDIAAACARFEEFCRAHEGVAPASPEQSPATLLSSPVPPRTASAPRASFPELHDVDQALGLALVTTDAVRRAVAGGRPPAREDLESLAALDDAFRSACERIGAVLGTSADSLPRDRDKLADALAAHADQARQRELHPLLRLRFLSGPPGRAEALEAIRRLASDLTDRQRDGWEQGDQAHVRALTGLVQLVDAVSQERDDEIVDTLAETVRTGLPDPSLVNAALRGQLTLATEPPADDVPGTRQGGISAASIEARADARIDIPQTEDAEAGGPPDVSYPPPMRPAVPAAEPRSDRKGLPGETRSAPGAGSDHRPGQEETSSAEHAPRNTEVPSTLCPDMTGPAGLSSSDAPAAPATDRTPNAAGCPAPEDETQAALVQEPDLSIPSPAASGTTTDPLELMAVLLEAGRFELAHHLAGTAEYRKARPGAMPASVPAALACAETARTDTGAVAAHLRDTLDRIAPDEIQRNRPALLLTAAAAARAAILCGHGTSELLRTAAGGLADLPALAEVISVIASGSEQGLLTGPHQLNALKPLMHADTLAKASAEAAAEELRRPRHLAFARATAIAARWWDETSGLIGNLLRIAATDDRQQVDHAAAALRTLSKSGRLAGELSQIDEELRDRGGHRLEGAARTRLLDYARESLDLINQWVQDVRSAEATTANTESWISGPLTDLRRAVLEVWPQAAAELEGFAATANRMSAAASHAARKSLETSVGLLDNRVLSGPEPDPVLLLNVDLLRAPGLSLTEEGHLRSVVTAEQISAAAATDLAQAFAHRLQAEDFGGARLLADTVGWQEEGPDEETTKTWFDTISREQELVRRELRSRIESVADRMSTAARYGRLLDPDRSRLDALLAGADIERGDLGAVRRHLAEIERELPYCARKAEHLLSERLQEALRHSEGVVAIAADAIRRRIADGDLATAEEYLINAQDGVLPPAGADHDELARFFPAVPERLTEGITAEVIGAANNGGRYGPLDFTKLADAERSQVAGALRIWFDTRTCARAATNFSAQLRHPLRMIGIESDGGVPSSGLTDTSHRRWIDLIGVRRTGDPLIPAFGSLTGDRLRLLLIWEQADVRTILSWVRQDVSDTPVLVCLFGPLGVDGRRRLAMETAKEPDKPVVVLDDTALSFLGTRGFGRMDAAMRLLLPFATVNPYFPHANDSIPPEMFYGRRSERTALAAPHGTNLIYGGRQFGKSALLRATERHVNGIGAQSAVYVCLPATFTAGELDHLWSRIGTRLRERAIVRTKRHAAPFDADSVSEAVRVWLDDDPERRLLLLLDECDGFFDADAAGGFVHTGRLRDLMNDTGRRFKVVFAGLHQVQRFAGLPNQPLAGAHLGVSAAIGPLHPDAAYNLLCVPTEALGIRFEDDSLVHHVLTYCNYQPKLLQLVGKALVEAVIARRAGEAPPYVVTKGDLETVLSAPDLRNEVRKATRLTLELDSRYKLIALVMAHHAHENNNRTMTTAELREACQQWWSAGFHLLGREEFRALLEEMVGLGVLARDRDQAWRVRSSNVLRLLGTSDEILDELYNEQWSKITDLAAETSRPLLPSGRTSPLTARQTADVLGEGRNQLRIVLGTPATGVDRVKEAVRAAAEPASDRFAYSAPNRAGLFRKSLTCRDFGKRHGVIVDDLTEKDVDAVLEAMNAALDQIPEDGATRAVTIVTDASRPYVLAAVTDPELAADPSSVVTLGRLSHAGLRSWATADGKDATFSTETDLKLLAESTGGWPMLLDWIEDDFSAPGVSASDACASLTRALATARYARSFVDATAIHTNVDVLDGWHRLIDYNDHLTRDEMVTLLHEPGTDASQVEVVIDALIALAVLAPEPDGRWIPEPILVKAWHTLYGGDA